MVGTPRRGAGQEQLRIMNESPVVIVLLRKPRKRREDESRSDPFYEHGSFGCTRCHAANVMHPARAGELEGSRIAFAQGGRRQIRLVWLTPPVRVKTHSDRSELIWTPSHQPFRFDAAPVLAHDTLPTDFPRLMDSIRDVKRSTSVAQFASAFRARRKPLDAEIAREVIDVFERARENAAPEDIAASYVDALPYPPNHPDTDRAARLWDLRAKIARNEGGPTGRATC